MFVMILLFFVLCSHLTLFMYEHLSLLGPVIICECQTFGLIQSSANQLQDSLKDGWEDISCCHSCLLQYLLSVRPFSHRSTPNFQPSNLLQAIIKEKIDAAAEQATILVIKLHSKSGIRRYSVVGNSSASIVTIFDVLGSERNVITCHSSFCKTQQSNKRTIEILESSSTLCPHLATFKAIYENLAMEMEN